MQGEGMTPVPLSQLTCGELQVTLGGKSGQVWERARKALRDNDVGGAHIAPHVESAGSVAAFFNDKLACPLTPFVAGEMLDLFRNNRPTRAPGRGQAGSSAGDDDSHSNSDSDDDSDDDSDSDSGDRRMRGIKQLLKKLQRHAKVSVAALGGVVPLGGGPDSVMCTFRCTNQTTGEGQFVSIRTLVATRDTPEGKVDLRRLVRARAIADFGSPTDDMQVSEDYHVFKFPKLRWLCEATNTATHEHVEFSVCSKDDDPLSSDPVLLQRFVRGVRFDLAKEKGWVMADTSVKVVSCLGLAKPRKYSFMAWNRSSGKVNLLSIESTNAGFEFLGPEARRASIDDLADQYAEENGLQRPDVHLFMGEEKQTVMLAVNTSTGQSLKFVHRTVVPDTRDDRADAALNACAEHARQNVAMRAGWPVECVQLQQVDEPVSTEVKTHPYRAKNTATGTELLLSVSTQDGRPCSGTPQQKAAFWQEVAAQYVFADSWFQRRVRVGGYFVASSSSWLPHVYVQVTVLLHS